MRHNFKRGLALLSIFERCHNHPAHVLSACRVQNEEAEALLSYFKEFWASQRREAAAKATASELTEQAASASPSQVSADSSTSAEQQLSSADSEGAAEDDARKAAENLLPSQQGGSTAADVAAGVVEGADSKSSPNQGRCSAALIYAC